MPPTAWVGALTMRLVVTNSYAIFGTLVNLEMEYAQTTSAYTLGSPLKHNLRLAFHRHLPLLQPLRLTVGGFSTRMFEQTPGKCFLLLLQDTLWNALPATK